MVLRPDLDNTNQLWIPNNQHPSSDGRASKRWVMDILVLASVTVTSSVAILALSQFQSPRAVTSNFLHFEESTQVSEWIEADIKEANHDSSTYQQYPLSQELFETLAYSDPNQLIKIVNDKQIDISLLTYAVESLGKITDSSARKTALSLLLDLLHHTSSLVREGVVYGLESYLNTEISEHLKQLLAEEPSPGVRAAIENILED